MSECPVCKGQETGPRRPVKPGVCHRCSSVRSALQKHAHLCISGLRRCGLIAAPESLACVDCNKPAKVYDHRSYLEPLTVEPVCLSCNKRRGAAVEFTPGAIEHITLEAA